MFSQFIDLVKLFEFTNFKTSLRDKYTDRRITENNSETQIRIFKAILNINTSQ